MKHPELLPIGNARAASKRLGLKAMIVFQELPDGRWGYTSYGQTKAICARTRKIADAVLHSVADTAADLDEQSMVEDGLI